ncbi:unnamed protein product [Miscanthus lutarioriparius]|uniref:Uncharacterized protein n=1 Tax=Miscanthus lutarioriparius TaxID=422564 RepID=A0A811N3P5_9POAL|nr:unnamed protein product [Miscanthus lutarioriparius]
MALNGSPSLSDVHLNDDGLPVAHNGVRHQPVFFLFIAAPSLASVGWASLCTFLFLYMSLVMRINLFRGVHFSLVWWAYNVPDDERSLATAVTNVLTKALAVGLSGMASITIAGVLMTTMYHAFVRKDLFPRCVHRCHAAAQGKFNKILAHFRASGDGVKDVPRLHHPKHGTAAPAADPTPTAPASRRRPWRVATAEQSRRPLSISTRF